MKPVGGVSKTQQLVVLCIYLPSCLSQVILKWPLRSSSQGATCSFQPNHSKEEAISLCALPKDITNELAGFSLHYHF